MGYSNQKSIGGLVTIQIMMIMFFWASTEKKRTVILFYEDYVYWAFIEKENCDSPENSKEPFPRPGSK